MVNLIRSRNLLPLMLLLLMLPSLKPFLQAQRLVFSGKGTFKDNPSAHPLSYWTENPLMRDDGGDLCIGCIVHSGKLTPADYKASVDLTRLGVLAGHQVLQLLISIHGDSATTSVGSEFKWKLLLESVAPDTYIEFYHLQPTNELFSNAAIVKVGQESVLASMDSDSGNGGGCWEGYWHFDEIGAHQLDFTKIYQAIDNIVPHNTTYTVGCYTLHLQDQSVQIPLQASTAPCHGCGWIGSVTAHFHLDGAKAVPENVVYNPSGAE